MWGSAHAQGSSSDADVEVSTFRKLQIPRALKVDLKMPHRERKPRPSFRKGLGEAKILKCCPKNESGDVGCSRRGEEQTWAQL